MNNALKKELALLTGIWALAGMRSRKPGWTAAGAALAAGLEVAVRGRVAVLLENRDDLALT